jgi:hypothetical protein
MADYFDSFGTLARRIYSSPVVTYGAPIDQGKVVAKAIYDGTLLPSFIHENGGDYKQYPQFLVDNRIGSVFDDLEEGQQVVVGQGKSSDQFSQHSEA